MNQTEYLALKKTLVQGGVSERREFIEAMPAAQLAEFIERLELFTADALFESTWRSLAQVMAIRASGYIFAVDGCPDRHNPDCTCPACEIDAVDVLAVQQRQVAEVASALPT